MPSARTMALPVAATLALAACAAPGPDGGGRHGRALGAEALRALITGNTVAGAFFAQPLDFHYAPEGRVYGAIGANTGNGAWRILEDGRYCHEWSVFFDSTERCYRWHPLGDGRYRMVNVDAYRTPDIDVWRIEAGLG